MTALAAAFRMCACGHTERRHVHDEDGIGGCVSPVCGCAEFREAAASDPTASVSEVEAIRSVAPETPYSCPEAECARTFATPQAVGPHRRKAHGYTKPTKAPRGGQGGAEAIEVGSATPASPLPPGDETITSGTAITEAEAPAAVQETRPAAAGLTADDLIRSWLHKRSHRHAIARNCPACRRDLLRVGITGLVYTHESCDCGEPEYTHLVEQLWHRECFAGQTIAELLLTRFGPDAS